MFIGAPTCSFKCDKECGQNVCQNSSLAKEPIINITDRSIINRYKSNPLTHAIVIGGLEPFDNFDELKLFIHNFRLYSSDPIIIYTGYYENEIEDLVNLLKEENLKSILIVKYGRFIPNRPHIYDEILGVELASDNQYAIKYVGDKNEHILVDVRENKEGEQNEEL